MTTTTKATKQNKKPTVAHAPQYPAVGMVSVWDFLGFFFLKLKIINVSLYSFTTVKEVLNQLKAIAANDSNH